MTHWVLLRPSLLPQSRASCTWVVTWWEQTQKQIYHEVNETKIAGPLTGTGPFLRLEPRCIHNFASSHGLHCVLLSHVEALTPRTSECDRIQRSGL